MTITALYAAVVGLLAAALTANVIRWRTVLKVEDGDGGSATMRKAIRAHGNLAQHAALAVLLIGFAEMAGTARGVIHGLGGVLVLARLSSAWGLLSAEGQTFGSQAGAGLTVLVMLVASILILLRAGAVI